MLRVKLIELYAVLSFAFYFEVYHSLLCSEALNNKSCLSVTAHNINYLDTLLSLQRRCL